MKRKLPNLIKVALPLLFLAGLGLYLGALPSASAQDAPAEPTKLEKVIVTGSNIPTAETVAIPPVEVYTAETIERTGAGSLEILAKKMPVAVGSGNYGQSRGNGGDGRSEISLRGIPGGTLLLINGRRTANQDLNAIPVGAIQEIQILKDGASAIYGADAVAGVVNIILKKDFTGAEMDAYYGNTLDTDTGEQRYSFITGLANENTSLLIGGSYYVQNSLYSGDRDRSRPDPTDPGQTSGTSMPGRIQTTDPAAPAALRTSGVVYRGAAGTTGASPADYTAFSNATDRFNYGLFTPAIRDSERWSVFGNGEHKLFGDHLKFFSESFYTHSYSYNQLAPTPIVFVNNTTPTSPNGIVIPITNPYNVFGVPINRARYRPVELGPRIDSNEYDILRFVGGLKGRIAETSWNWEAAVLHTYQYGVNRQGNDISRTGLEQAVNSTNRATAFNVFGNLANSAAVLDAIRLDHYTFTRDKLFAIDAKVNGEVVQLPAGPLAVAAGGEHRQERGVYEPDATLIYNNVVGFNGSQPFTGERDVYGLFYEIKIPVLGGEKKLPAFYGFEITHAGRYEEYSDFGNTYNPKLQFKWFPVDDSFAIRGSYSESFTAPGFGDLYLQAQESYPELRNPVKFNAGDPTFFDQIRTFYSGNPDLKPTTANNYTIGLVWSPKFVKNLTLSLDYFRIAQENIPASVDQYILDQNYASGGPFSPTARYANLIDYDAATTNYNTLYAPTLNLSRRIVEGLDMALHYQVETDNTGTFMFTLAADYFTRFVQENIPGDGLQDRLGDFVDPSQSFGLGSLPRLKGTANVVWSYRDFELSTTANYISSYRDDVANGFDREIDDWLTFDFQASYKLPWNMKATLGVLNATDAEPPLAQGAFADNYDRDTHDLRGRVLYVSLNKKF